MDNEMRKILESAAKNSAITIKALELADKLNADMVEAVELGRPAQYREKVFQQRRVEMAKEIFDLVEAEAGKLQAGIAEDRKKWEESAQRRLHARAANLEMARNHFQGISLQALERELEDISSAKFTTQDPEVVEAALATARARGIDTVVVDAHYKLLSEKNYTARWLQSPEAAQSQKEITLYANRGRDAFNVPIVFGDGKTSSLSFEDILDGASPSDTQGADDE